MPDASEQAPPAKPINLRDEIASLEAQFRNERQAYAKRPRVKRLTAASTLQEPEPFIRNPGAEKSKRLAILTTRRRLEKTSCMVNSA